MSAPAGYEMLQVPTRGGRSADIYNQLSGQHFQNLLGMSQGNLPFFQANEKYAQDMFNQQIAPGIANRYAGSGIGASSGMQNAIAGAGANLSSQLAAQRQNLMLKAAHEVNSLGDLLLRRPDVENYLSEGGGGSERPWWHTALEYGLPVVGAIAGGVSGLGPAGAVAGFQMGRTIGGAFSDRGVPETDWKGISNLPRTWDRSQW